MVCMVTLLVTFLDIACDRTWTDRRRAVTLSAFCCCWIAGRARFRGACAFAIAFGAAALALLNADDLRRSALTPWSATCYPTRPAEGVSAAQAEYEGLAGHHGCHPKCRGRAGSHRNIRLLACPSRWARIRFLRRNIFVIRTTSALCYIASQK